MSDKHVFISYIREDEPLVRRMADALTRAGIRVWIDRESLQPGTRWRNAIRKAIEDGAFFIACFSDKYGQKPQTYMDEELTLAIDELQQYSIDHSWFIPVRLVDCTIPARDIGGDQTLRDIQWVDLFIDWDTSIAKLVTTVAAAKRHPPKSGNSMVSDTSIDMAERIKNVVTAWINNGRSAGWLVSGKAFFAVNCWLMDRMHRDRDNPALTEDVLEYQLACKEATGGDEGWENILSERTACEVCREIYRLENIRLDTKTMQYYCYRCAPNHDDVVG